MIAESAVDGGQMSPGLGRELVGQIRALILDGTIAQGSKLLPREVQERFGVSHIPVREALRALESEGLVVTLPRRGTRVAGMSLAELREVYALRRSIEPDLMVTAVLARDENDIIRARHAHHQLHSVVGSGNIDAFLAAHAAFHGSLLHPATGPTTTRILKQLWTVSERYVRMSVAAFHTDQMATHDHASLLDAFVAGDADTARSETAHHLELVESTTVQALTNILT
ncbi:MAG: GntR family transcriptional regulator [Actinomycetes bacterium]